MPVPGTFGIRTQTTTHIEVVGLLRVHSEFASKPQDTSRLCACYEYIRNSYANNNTHCSNRGRVPVTSTFGIRTQTTPHIEVVFLLRVQSEFARKPQYTLRSCACYEYNRNSHANQNTHRGRVPVTSKIGIRGLSTTHIEVVCLLRVHLEFARKPQHTSRLFARKPQHK